MKHTYSSPAYFRFLQFLFFITWLYFLSVKPASGQTGPANDNCSGAINLVSSITCTSVNGSSSGATQSMLACAAGGTADDDVWFKFTATKKQHAIKVTGSANYDAVLEVFAGSCSNLTSLACSDATSIGQAEIAQPDGLVIGNVYYVRVYHYKGSYGSGSFTICVSDASNDFCEGAKELISGINCTPESGNLQAATQSFPGCSNSGTANDVWYKFTATTMAHDVFVTPGTGVGLSVEAFTGGSCNTLTSIKCQTPAQASAPIELAPLVPGQTYFLRVYTNQSVTVSRPFTICVKERILPAGSVCNNAINIASLPFNSGVQTTCGKGDFYRSNFLQPQYFGEEMVFKIDVTNAPVSYLMTLKKLTSTAKGLGISVFRDCPNPVTDPVNYLGDAPMGTNQGTDSSMITLNTNGTYYFVVDRITYIGDACGQFEFNLKSVTPPANDECINATSLTVGKTCIPYNGTSIYATQSLPGAGTFVADDDVWFSFVAKGPNHKIVLDRENTFSYFGVMELYSGSCSNLTSIQSLSNNAAVTFDLDAKNLIAGQTYYVRVYHRAPGWADGRFTICVSEYIANDECTGAIALPVAGLNATPAPLLATTAVATQSMPVCGTDPNTFANDDVWFKFTATAAYQEIKVIGLDKNGQIGQFNFRPILELFSGSCTNLNSMVCTAPTWLNAGIITTTNLVPGATYYLRVFDQSKDIFYDKFTIQIKELPAPAPGENCATAVPITAFPYNSGKITTCGSKRDYNINCRGSGPNTDEYMFRINVTNAPVSYKMTLHSKGGGNLAAVFNGCPSPVMSPNNCLPGKYEAGIAGTFYAGLADHDTVKTDIFNFNANGTYYIAVVEWNGSNNVYAQPCGEFSLQVELAPPAPVNDHCSTATLLPVGTSCSPVNGTSAGASRNSVPASCDLYFGASDDDVWYKFVATSTNSIINIQGSTGYRPGMQFFRGSCTSFIPVACSQTFNASGRLTYYAENLTPGTTYYFSVFDQRPGFGITGNFTVCVTESTPRPAGSTCAIPVTIPAIPFNSGSQTTCGKGDDYGSMGLNSRTFPETQSYYGGGEDMVYKLVVSAVPVTYNVTLSGSTQRRALRVVDTCPVSYATANFYGYLTTGTDTISSGNFSFTKTGTYYFVVDNWAGPGDPICADFRLKIDPASYPVNDECASAVTLGVNATCSPVSGNLSTATNSMPETCSINRPDDIWYKFVAPASRNVSVSVIGSGTLRPEVELFEGLCGSTISLSGCGKFNADSVTHEEFYNLIPGTTYYLRVYSKAYTFNGSGNFTICITTPPVITNSVCGNAVNLPVTGVNVCNPVNGSTEGSFAVAGLPGCSGAADDNAWYKFTATASAQRIKVAGTIGFDPVVEVFSGNCGNWNSVGCSDNTSFNDTENLDLNNLTVGQEYLVRVYHQTIGFGSGNFSICAQDLPPAPANDFCINAITVAADTVCTTPVSSTVLNATQSLPGCSGIMATDVWYSFTALGAEVTINVANTGSADLVIQLFSGSCNAPSSLMCRDTAVAGGNERLTFAGTKIGQKYYVRVYAYSKEISNGNFSICVRSGSIRAIVPSPPALSSFCAGATFKLPFEAFGPFFSANEFRAELSDANGNFANPVLVGTRSGASVDTFLISVPFSTAPGNLYKIRFLATAPGYVSPATMPLTILAVPSKPVVTPAPVYCSGETVAPLMANGSNLRWYSDAQLTNLVGSGVSFTPPVLFDTTSYFITQTTTGCQSQATELKVMVKPKPDVFFTGLDTVYCASTQPIALTPTVAGGTFGGSLVFGNTFIPALAGNHTISYTRTQNGCTATFTKTVKVKAGPPALVGPQPVICSGDTVQIGSTPNPNFIYSWSPVSGLSNPAISNPAFTATNPDAVNDTIVKILEVTDPSNGCTTTAILKIVVKGGVVVSAGNDRVICADAAPVMLTGAPSGGSWSGALGVSASGVFNPAVSGIGTHHLIYTVLQNGCSRTDTMQINVEMLPVADAGFDADICSGGSVTIGTSGTTGYTFSWTPVSGLSNATVSNPVFSLTNSSTQNDTILKVVTVTNILSGCANSDTVQVIVKPQVMANAGNDVTMCASSAAAQLNGSPVRGAWSGSPAVTASGLFDPAVAGTGTHKLYFSVQQNGCSAKDSMMVTVAPLPLANAGTDALICSGGSVYLGMTMSASYTFSWSPAAGLSNTAISDPVFSATNSGTQNDTITKILTVTNPATGCTQTDTVRIIVKPAVVISAGSDMTLCLDAAAVTLNASPAGGTWSSNAGLNGLNFNPALAGAGTHQLIYSATVNGCTNSDTLKISVVSVPTPFIILFGADSLISTVSGSSYSWLLNGVPMSSTAAGVRPNQTGLYQVIVWNGNCASDTSATFNYAVNSIGKAEKQTGISLFPNPTDGKATLNLTGFDSGRISVILLDALGRKVDQRLLKTSEKEVQFNWSELPNGMYLLQLNSEGKTYYRKVVIQK